MLPKWKQGKYILALLFWILSLYDENEREVWSMALNDNIKKFREEKNLTQQQLADKLYVSRQTVCRWEKGSRCPDLITAKKLALELDVSVDELISDEDVKDYQKNYGIWKSEKVRSRKKLQELQKKTLSFIEIIGALFLTATIFFRVQMHQKVPEWCTIVCLCVVLGAVVLNLVISRKLRKIEDL